MFNIFQTLEHNQLLKFYSFYFVFAFVFIEMIYAKKENMNESFLYQQIVYMYLEILF
jgi:hypothetical protein